MKNLRNVIACGSFGEELDGTPYVALGKSIDSLPIKGYGAGPAEALVDALHQFGGFDDLPSFSKIDRIF